MLERKIAIEKLMGHVQADHTNWRARAQERKESRQWCRRSQEIAIRILRTLKDKNMQQKDLAELMGVAPQQVSRWVKGKENFTLETVGRIEHALGIQLLEVPVIIKEEFPQEPKVTDKIKSSGGIESYKMYLSI